MKRIRSAGAFFAVSLMACLGVGAAYAELTERVCAGYVDQCADPERLMVYPQIANGPNVPWSNSYPYGGFYEYGPRE